MVKKRESRTIPMYSTGRGVLREKLARKPYTYRELKQLQRHRSLKSVQSVKPRDEITGTGYSDVESTKNFRVVSLFSKLSIFQGVASERSILIEKSLPEKTPERYSQQARFLGFITTLLRPQPKTRKYK